MKDENGRIADIIKVAKQIEPAVEELAKDVPEVAEIEEEAAPVVADVTASVTFVQKIWQKLGLAKDWAAFHKKHIIISTIIVVLAVCGGIGYFAIQTNTGRKVTEIVKQYVLPQTRSAAVNAQANFEKNIVDKGGRGAVYSVPHDTYDAFRSAVLGKSYNIDGAYGAQCWDGVALLYQQDGRNFSTGGTGAAKNTWIEANGGGNFELIAAKDAHRGDIIVFDIGTYGHVGFLDSSWGSTIKVLGQNQTGDGNGAPFSVISLSSNSAVGAIRYLPWKTTPVVTTPVVTTPAATATTETVSYIVKRGDTLGQIIINTGWRDDTKVLFGNSGQAQELANYNDIANRGLIYPGEVIKEEK